MDNSINGLKIDPAIFTFKFGCKCNGECCYYGVYTDLKEHEEIMALKDRIKLFMDDSQPLDDTLWFEEKEKDPDFESGYAVGTELHNGKCVFLDKEGLCSLQKMAYSENAYKWKYKPLYCVLFPLTIFEKTLTIDYEHTDRLKHCNKKCEYDKTIFEYCSEELLHLLGEEGFKELTRMRDEYMLQKEAI